mmetsp:Transcript_13740/g.15964  ORF Transcript_13740/g.15964 Transcript_13740/m.15964 type:complete len:387 (-) Transcript_13740:421-1581(-)
MTNAESYAEEIKAEMIEDNKLLMEKMHSDMSSSNNEKIAKFQKDSSNKLQKSREVSSVEETKVALDEAADRCREEIERVKSAIITERNSLQQRLNEYHEHEVELTTQQQQQQQVKINELKKSMASNIKKACQDANAELESIRSELLSKCECLDAANSRVEHLVLEIENEKIHKASLQADFDAYILATSSNNMIHEATLAFEEQISVLQSKIEEADKKAITEIGEINTIHEHRCQSLNQNHHSEVDELRDHLTTKAEEARKAIEEKYFAILENSISELEEKNRELDEVNSISDSLNLSLGKEKRDTCNLKVCLDTWVANLERAEVSNYKKIAMLSYSLGQKIAPLMVEVEQMTQQITTEREDLFQLPGDESFVDAPFIIHPSSVDSI